MQGVVWSWVSWVTIAHFRFEAVPCILVARLKFDNEEIDSGGFQKTCGGGVPGLGKMTHRW